MAMPQLVTKKRWYEKNVRKGVFDQSPMPAEDGPLPRHSPRMPNPFPPADWVADIRGHARSTESAKTRGPAEEAEVKANRAKFEKALARADVNKRTEKLAKALRAQLKVKNAKRERPDTQHPAEARIQRACISLEALLAAGKDFDASADRQVLLRAMEGLTPEQQTDLMRADEETGRRLYSALYLVSQEDVQLKDRFAQVKGAAQQARLESKFDKHDPSGETSEILQRVLRHVDEAGLRDEEKKAFVEKLNFKLTIQPAQGNQPDLPLPDTTIDGWSEKFTARTLSTLAETPAVSDDSIEQALNMPATDLVKVLGHAYIGPKDKSPRDNPDLVRREGDMRLTRVARGLAVKKNNPDLLALLEGLESNHLNRRRMLEEAQKGTPVKRILWTLEAEAAKDAAKLAAEGEQRLEESLKHLGPMQTALEKQLAEVKEQIWKGRKPRRPDVARLEELAGQQKELLRVQARLEKTKVRLEDAEPPTPEQTLLLMKRFGRFPLDCLEYRPSSGYDPDYEKYGTAAVIQHLKDLLDTLDRKAESFRQVKIQVAAAEDPRLLKKGLTKSSYVLPTAGKPLKNCPWLQSTAEDLVRIATAIREVEQDFTLDNNPIIVLDQTDGNGKDPAKTALWKQNDDFLKKLEADYKGVGLTIKHVSMAHINGMMKGSGVEKLFDTTGEGSAGYGGARNIGFLLGPIIQDAVRKGEDPTKIKPEELAKRIKASALTKAPKVFMGDDTDYVAPGGVASKAALAASKQHADEYSLIGTRRSGRDTQGVSSAYPNGAVDRLEEGGLDAFTNSLYTANIWNPSNKVAGMGCSFGEPRFCLDLPTGKEEKQCEASVYTLDQFGQTSHLSGDRQTAPSAFLKSYMLYSNMTETVNALFDVGELPWNAEAAKRKSDGADPFANLGEVMTQAVNPAKQKEMQKSTLTRLVAWREANPENGGPLQLDGNQAGKVQEYLDHHPEIDAESRDELTKIQAVYEEGKRQAQLMKAFTDRLLAELQLPAKASAEDLHGAIDTCLQDPASVQKAIKKVRDKMGEEGAEFNASNSMLRDLALILESVAGGGFSDLCDKLVNAA